MCSHCLRASCNFFYGASGAPRGKSVQRLCGDCTEPCNVSAVAVQSPKPPRTEIVRSPCGDRPSHGARTGIVQCHLRHVYGLRSCDFFTNFYNFSLNQIVEAAEPVNPYENLTAASCLRREASRRPHGKGDTGSVDPSQSQV